MAKRAKPMARDAAKAARKPAARAPSLQSVCRVGIPGYDPWATAGKGQRWNRARATHAVEFFSHCLKHIEGATAGEPFVLRPWQQAIVGNLFGWVNADGARRYRECLLYVPRGNGKTPLGAGIALYMTFADGEVGAQTYMVASAADQAAIAFRHASGFVLGEPALGEVARVYRATGQRAIISRTDPATVMRVIPSEAGTAHGHTPHCVCGDELHAWENYELVEALETGFAKRTRRQPLLLYMTTADWVRESPCNTKYEYACKVRDGQLSDPAFLPVIYEAGEKDDWTDPAVWAKANPNLGVTVSVEALARECERARAEPSVEMGFRRLHLNQRTAAAEQWIGGIWSRCDGPIDVAALAGRACYAGLDLSQTRDLTALCLAFPPESEPDGEARATPEQCYQLLWWFWLPQEILAHQDRLNMATYRQWADAGHILRVPGDVIDYRAIADTLTELSGRYRIVELAADPYNAEQFVQQLGAVDGLTVKLHPQGFRDMSEPSKFFEQLVARGRLRHGNNPVARWMAGNVTVLRDKQDNIKPVKSGARGKIDGIIAAIMATNRARSGQKPAAVFKLNHPIEWI